MHKKRRFKDEELNKANRVNLIAYAEGLGLVLKKAGRSYKVNNYGGLYIDAQGSKWNWFSQNKGGGPIQFVMEMEGKSWVEAVYTLLGNEASTIQYAPQSYPEEVKGEFILPEKNDTYKHVIAYLIQTRGIDKDILYDFIKKDKIYENRYRSCVFVGYDENHEPKYASVRSTNTQGKVYRGDVKNSDKVFPFCSEGSSKTICVFEAPIDLMSYLTLLKYHGVRKFNHHMISLGGVADKALEYYLQQHPEIDTIMLCLDNDEAGHFACQQINGKYHEHYKILRHSPVEKDFNKDLIEIKRNQLSVQAMEVKESYETELNTGEEIEI